MMLSGDDIRKMIEKGALALDPYYPRSVGGAAVALHLGPELLRPLPGKTVDILNKTLPDYEAITITKEKPYCVAPGDFVLGHTFEKVTVGKELGFMIEGRSTLARIGLTVVQTAMIVNPGHRNRTITLEIANHSPNPVLLYPKMKIAHAAIFELKTPSSAQYDDRGKYREQVSVGKPVFGNNEFLPE